MKTTGIIGFGVLGRQILHFLMEEKGSLDRVLLFDDNRTQSETFEVVPFSSYLQEEYNEVEFYIGLGYNHLKLRKEIISRLLTNGRKVKTFIHHSSYVSPNAVVEEGCILFPFVNVDQNVKILKGNILHNNVIVSHDSMLKECSYLSPGVVVAGNVIIGSCCFLGAGSIVRNAVQIGESVVVGMGTVVSSDVEKNLSVIGNPMKTLNKKLNIE